MSKLIWINTHQFALHPSGAVYWPAQQSLLVADVHLGKVTHFRKNGAAVPLKASEENYLKLDKVLNQFEVSHIYFLGDLFHSAINSEWDRFGLWVKNCGASVSLIEGNHDIISPYRYHELGVEVLPDKRIAGFLLTHHPTEEAGSFNFCGHIHPGIRMQGTGRQTLKLACFYKNSQQMILPAFGSFTGKHLLRPGADDEVYVIAKNEVISVT